MKKLLKIIFFTIILLVSSCNKIEITEPFELMEGDYLFVDMDLDKCNNIDFSKKEIMSFNTTGLMRAKNKGETTCSFEYKDGTTKNIDFTVTERKLKEIDEEKNQKYEKELKSKITSFTKKIERSNYLLIDKIGFDSIANIKMRANPLYIEQTDGKETRVITKENGAFYEYETLRDSESLIKKDYAKDEEDFNIKYEASYYYFDASKTLEYFFDYKKGNIDYINGYYILRGKYEDCLNEELRNLIDSETNLDSETYDLLMNSLVSMYFKFQKNEVILGATAYLKKDIFTVSSTGAFRIRVEKFKPINLKENVIEEKPSDLNGFVPEKEMVNKPYTFASGNYSVECVCTVLEEGQYFIKAGYGDAKNITIEVYDENKKLVNARYSPAISETFYIPKTGKYYLVMRKNITGKVTFTLTKANYKTIASLNNPEKLQSGELIIEGYMDLHYYEYENPTDHDQKVSIRNFGKITITIVTEENGEIIKRTIPEGETYIFTATPGKNTLIIYDQFETYYKEGSIDLLIKVTISE